jgi:hypothetical protein
LAAALMTSAIALVATTLPAHAQVSFSVSFGYFHNALAPYGHWYHHPRWGDVWRPARVEIDFRPYHRGRWRHTNQFGWVWVSDYIWGDIPFHYGRWVYDPFDGWLWVPGYVWSPAWVIWRSGGGYIGWFPMPPDDGFLFGNDLFRTRWDNWDRAFGYYDWYGSSFGPNWFISFWIFVEDRHFADRDYIRYIPPRNRFTSIVNSTTNVTNYVTVNNYIVNRSVDLERVERAAGRSIRSAEPSEVVRRGTPVTTVDVGRRIEERQRAQHERDPNASPGARISSLPGVRARAIERTDRSDRDLDKDGEVARPSADRPEPRVPSPRREDARPQFDEHEGLGTFVPQRGTTPDRSLSGPQTARPPERVPERRQAPVDQPRREVDRPSDRPQQPPRQERGAKSGGGG